MNTHVLYGENALPDGVRSRLIDNNNGCTMHVLEAGFERPGRPCIVLLHGFPELAFSWRKQLPFLAAAGFHVVAPDQRGYGRSTGTDVAYEDDLLAYTFLNRVSDTLGLVKALGCDQVAAVIGHDYGSLVAAWCALVRPDVFRSVILMSAPFSGAPALPMNTGAAPAKADSPSAAIPQALAQLARPRKHYRWYYSTPQANSDMWHCPQGVHDFLRAYYHFKSGDWNDNNPHPLASWSASELAKMPTYYVMDLDTTMAEAVAPEMPSAKQIADCRWLPDDEMAVYAAEYRRTGFQGGLQGYRVSLHSGYNSQLRAFSDRTIDVPACFIAGARDWGSYQAPGALERMANEVCSKWVGTNFVDGAGHWVQQERPEEVNRLLGAFLERFKLSD